MSRPIYVIGHKHSDLDSVASAYSYARLLQLRGEAQPIAARQGGLKPVTLRKHVCRPQSPLTLAARLAVPRIVPTPR